MKENCAITLTLKTGRIILLRSCYHDREFYPLENWVTFSYHCPINGAISFDIDIREILELPGEGECPVCRLAVYLSEEGMTMDKFIKSINPTRIRNSL